MYPGFYLDAEKEGSDKIKRELLKQMQESKEHADLFQKALGIPEDGIAAGTKWNDVPES